MNLNKGKQEFAGLQTSVCLKANWCEFCYARQGDSATAKRSSLAEPLGRRPKGLKSREKQPIYELLPP